VRVPLIVRHPAYHHLSGARLPQLVELVDVAPTVMDWAGLSGPSWQGTSLRPLLDSPHTSGREVAFSQYPALLEAGPRPGQFWGHAMGYSARTATWRFTLWVVWDNVTATARWDTVLGRELYDHRGISGEAWRPWAWENVNLAADPAYGGVVEEMTALVRGGPFR